ncbi:TVP38/TMEM64 family protein [Paenibacillus albidus]|uniref:TVP38/TMEM64 family protein n=1 Tax=Paenibacillus albidus TaxID=2041023 RepID=UPI001BEC6398|nr:VTT domain-containing protein [Paenibacillus albidus]MBT2290624.1 TVP38/TMEM64 family protein [Paenibacillus albidus]
MSKWLAALLYVSGTIAAFIYRYDILSWMKEDHPLVLLIGTATLLAMFPVVPYKAVISLFGYAYGSVAGAAICWAATTLAAALMFGGVKYLFKDRARAYLASVPSLAKFTEAVERRPFASVILARLAPVIPQTAVNVYAGAAALPFWNFLAATGIGKIPGIALFAFLGGNALQSPASAVAAIFLYLAVLGLAWLGLRSRTFK